MRQTASPTRTATNRSAPAVRALRRVIAALLFLLPFAGGFPSAHAQTPMDLGMTSTHQRSKFVGGSASDNFYLRGATVDFAYSPFHGIGPVVSLNGLAVTNL